MEEVGSRAIRSTGKQKRRWRGVEAPGAAGDGELSSLCLMSGKWYPEHTTQLIRRSPPGTPSWHLLPAEAQAEKPCLHGMVPAGKMW